MPCADYNDSPSRTIQDLRDDKDLLTDMLCHALALCVEADVRLPARLMHWHQEHRKNDIEYIKERVDDLSAKQLRELNEFLDNLD